MALNAHSMIGDRPGDARPAMPQRHLREFYTRQRIEEITRLANMHLNFLRDNFQLGDELPPPLRARLSMYWHQEAVREHIRGKVKWMGVVTEDEIRSLLGVPDYFAEQLLEAEPQIVCF